MSRSDGGNSPDVTSLRRSTSFLPGIPQILVKVQYTKWRRRCQRCQETSTEITVRCCQQESCISGTVGEGHRSLQERSSVVPGLRWLAAHPELKHAVYGLFGASNWRLVTELSSCCSMRRKGTPIQVLMGSMTAPPRPAKTHVKHQAWLFIFIDL